MKFTFPEYEEIKSSPWQKKVLPRKILLIRLHTFGDVMVAMPVVQHLKELLPEVELHLLTGLRFAAIPMNMPAITKVITLKNARGGWKMGLDMMAVFPQLLFENYDCVIDLQNNKFSRTLRKALFPKAWSQFDRYSRIHAISRYQNTVNAIGLVNTEFGRKVVIKDELSGLDLLRGKGWNNSDPLIILNPCGRFSTRKWGAENYLQFARLWIGKVDTSAKFVLLGYDSLSEFVVELEKSLGLNVINLIGKTTVKEVFNIVRHADLILSDDGALLHAGWINQIPTIGFLGSSPSYWGRPLGEKSFAYTSEDLSCGNCHNTVCQRGDNHCLTRVTPSAVLEKAVKLLGISIKIV